MENIAEECARILAFRYESQIRQLQERGAQMLAECGVRRMLEAMRSGCLDALEDTHTEMVEQLVNSVPTVDKKQGTLAIKHQEIPTIVVRPKKHRWNECAVFKKPGIKTINGDYFSGPSTDVAQYGYRIGTAEEAKALGYSLDNVRRASSLDLTVCFYTPPKVRVLLQQRTAPLPSKKGETKPLKLAGPPVPAKRLQALSKAAPSVPPPPPPARKTDDITTPAKRRSSVTDVAEANKETSSSAAVIAPTPERAVSPAKFESPAGPSPLKGDFAESPFEEIKELRAMMGAMMERNAQESARVARLEAKLEEQKQQLQTANARIGALEEQLSDASWTHRIQELFLKQLQAIGWTNKESKR